MIVGNSFDMLTSPEVKSFVTSIIRAPPAEVHFQLSLSSEMTAITLGILLLVTGYVTCDRIQNYNQVGASFMQNFYASFDNVLQRASVRNYYDVTDSAANFRGELLFGADGIMARLNSFTNVIQRNIFFADYQPTSDAGVILNVFGKISYDVNTGNSSFFSEMFVIKPRGSNFYIQNQQFRASTPNNSNNNNVDSLHFA